MEQGTRNKERGLASPPAEARGFRGLLAWQKADDLASAVCRTLTTMPADHRWLTGQAMRSAISVPANIAEGYGRGSLGDYLRFLDIARGSLAELEYYLHFIEREGLVAVAKADDLHRMHQETGRLLHGLWKSLEQKARDGGWDHSGQVNERSATH